MIRFKQFIAEAGPWNVMTNHNKLVDVYRVKTAAGLKTVMARTPILRGMLFRDHIDLWASFEAVHHDYIQAFDPDTYPMPIEIYIERGRASDQIEVSTSYASDHKYLHGHPLLATMIPNMLIVRR